MGDVKESASGVVPLGEVGDLTPSSGYVDVAGVSRASFLRALFLVVLILLLVVALSRSLSGYFSLDGLAGTALEKPKSELNPMLSRG